MREQLCGFLDADLLTKPNVNNGKLKVLDFKEVARIIIKEKPKKIEAGLLTDWEYTCVYIYQDGIVNNNIGSGYLGSRWATPAIIITDQNDNEVEEKLFVMQDSYDSDIMFDEETLQLFRDNNIEISE